MQQYRIDGLVSAKAQQNKHLISLKEIRCLGTANLLGPQDLKKV